MSYSKSFNLEQLFNYAKRHALYYFNEVIKSCDFVQADHRELLDYFTSQHLNCSSEIDILDAVFKWYSYDKSNRKPLLKELLPCFHGDIDEHQQKWDTVQNHELVRESKEWQTHIDEIKGRDDTTKNKDKVSTYSCYAILMSGP